MTATNYQDLTATVAGLRLHYQEWGQPDAPAVLMVHGFGVSGHMFDEFAERARDRYRLIALDQRGHGDSDWSPDGDYTREAFVQDIEGFRESLGLQQFILIGHSMGGLNSVWYAARYPEHVRALVLIDVGPESAKEGVDNIVRFTRGPDELEFEQFVEMAHRFNQRRSIENIRERMRHRLKPTDSGKWTWKFDRRFREQDGTLRIGHQVPNDEMWQMFRSLSMPVLLIRGAESDVLTQETAERLEREMQQARLVVVPAAGHSVPGDNPEAFTEEVRAFLQGFDSGQFDARGHHEPPPIGTLLDHEPRTVRRQPSLLPLVVGALAACAALVLVVSGTRRGRAERQPRTARGAAATSVLSAADIARAQRKASELAADLTEAGKAGVGRARAVLGEVDLDQARTAARDLLEALGERTAAASESVSDAVERTMKRRKRRRRVLLVGLGHGVALTARTGARAMRKRHR